MRTLADELRNIASLNSDVVVSAELLQRAAAAIGMRVCNCCAPDKIEHKGECLTRKQWAMKLGIHPDTVRWRIKNWGSIERIPNVQIEGQPASGLSLSNAGLGNTGE